MRSKNASTNEAIGLIGNKFNKAIRRIVNFADENFGERNNGGFIFTIATNKNVFAKSDSDQGWIGVGEANKAVIIGGVFGFLDKIISLVAGYAPASCLLKGSLPDRAASRDCYLLGQREYWSTLKFLLGRVMRKE